MSEGNYYVYSVTYVSYRAEVRMHVIMLKIQFFALFYNKEF